MRAFAKLLWKDILCFTWTTSAFAFILEIEPSSLVIEPFKNSLYFRFRSKDSWNDLMIYWLAFSIDSNLCPLCRSIVQLWQATWSQPMQYNFKSWAGWMKHLIIAFDSNFSFLTSLFLPSTWPINSCLEVHRWRKWASWQISHKFTSQLTQNATAFENECNWIIVYQLLIVDIFYDKIHYKLPQLRHNIDCNIYQKFVIFQFHIVIAVQEENFSEHE